MNDFDWRVFAWVLLNAAIGTAVIYFALREKRSKCCNAPIRAGYEGEPFCSNCGEPC